MEQLLGSVAFQIPHSSEVERQYLEGELLAGLCLKESRAFRKEIEKNRKGGVWCMKNNQNLFFSPGGEKEGHLQMF